MLRSKPLKHTARSSIAALLGCLLLWIEHLAADDSSLPPATLQRATLTVANLDRSLNFYQDILGLTVSARSQYDTHALRKMFHVPERSKPELVLLDAGPEQPRALALVHAAGLVPDREANFRHAPALLFNTVELDRIHAAMLNSDFEVSLAPSPLNDFEGNPFGREAAYLDPDGVRVILLEHE